MHPCFIFIISINNNGHPRLFNRSYYLNTCSSQRWNDCYLREAVKMVNGANKWVFQMSLSFVTNSWVISRWCNCSVYLLYTGTDDLQLGSDTSSITALVLLALEPWQGRDPGTCSSSLWGMLVGRCWHPRDDRMLLEYALSLIFILLVFPFLTLTYFIVTYFSFFSYFILFKEAFIFSWNIFFKENIPSVFIHF